MIAQRRPTVGPRDPFQAQPGSLDEPPAQESEWQRAGQYQRDVHGHAPAVQPIERQELLYGKRINVRRVGEITVSGEAPDGQPERQPEHAIRKGNRHERFTKPAREVGWRRVGRAKGMMEPLMWRRVYEA